MKTASKLAIGLVLALLGTGMEAASAANATAPPTVTPAAAPVAAPVVVDRTLTGDAACTRCHDENENKPILSMYQTKHGVKADGRTPGCQSCHGTSLGHQRNVGGSGGKRTPPDVTFGLHAKADPKAQAGACLTCHSGGKRAMWEGSHHESRDVPCAACHTVHAKQDPMVTKTKQQEVCFGCHKTQRAQSHLTSTHPLVAGKVTCSDCHNPHGSVGPKSLAKNSVNETCYGCHAEKRGPFLWEHGPVADDCTTCHTPHGSNNAPMLKARVPWLCQECHSGDHGAQLNSGANLAGGNVTTVNGIQPLAGAAPRAQAAARACLNCHVLVHGSNHPAGSKFQR